MRNGYRYYIESTMRKFLMVCICVLLLVMLVPPASAYGYYVVNVLVAYDEEWITTSRNTYFYEPEELAEIIVEEVSWRFESFTIYFDIVDYVYWNSYDSPNYPGEMLDEAVDDVGFTSGVGAHILIALTGQDIPYAYGYTNRTLGVVLVGHAYLDGVGQATDNVLQHELSHLYGLEHENIDGLDCVMNIYHRWIDFPWYYYVRWALTTSNWCEDSVNVLSENLGYWGQAFPAGGGGGRRCAW